MSVNHRRLHRRQAHTLGDLTTISLPGIGDEPTSTHDAATTTSVKAQTTSTSDTLIPPVEHTFTSTTSQIAAATTSTTQTPQTTSTTAVQVTTTPQTTQAVTPTTTSPQAVTTNTTPTTQQTSPVTTATPVTPTTNTAASPTTTGTSTGVTTPANTIATTPGAATTAVGVTTGNVVTTIQTVQPTTGTASATVPSLAASASATTSTSSHVSAGTVIGGLVAAGVGIAAIAFAIMFFMRRWRQKRDNEEWSAALARRQSVMLEDDKLTRGNDPWAPRPPTMIERKQDAPLPMPPPQVYNNPGPHDYNDYPQQQQQQYPQMSFVPGQVMPVNPYAMPPMGYPSTPGTPFTANSSAPFVTSFNQQGIPPQLQPAVAPGQVMRQPSFGSPQLARQPSTGTQALMSRIPNDPNAHYMDLDRSSVTPFQAAQYAEISRKLNTDENRGSGAPSAISDATMVNDVVVPPAATKVEEFGNHVPLSPMEEEPLEEMHEPPFSPVMPAGPQLISVNGYADEPESPTGFDNEMGMAISDVDLEPPSTHVAAERIESIPPSLPEHRPFSPVSIPTFENNSNNNASHSSPLAQPENVVTEPEQQQEQPAPAPALQPTERKRPETVYNEDDVYGGF